MSSTTTETATEVAGANTIKLTSAFDDKTHSEYKYNAYLPVYDETTTFPATEEFDVSDRGFEADQKKPNLLENADAQVTLLTPRIGTEIRGLQLSKLSNEQKNELALLLGERGVVVFKDQDFKDIGGDKQKEFAQYFGPLHVHVSNSRRIKCHVRPNTDS